MTFCNLGRPSRDAAFQNFTINDSVRVNKILKAGRSEIDRLCASNNNNSSTFIGSIEYTGLNSSPGTLPFGYTIYALPSGIQYLGNDTTDVSSSSLRLTLYTDVDLTIRKFQCILIPEIIIESPPVQIDVSVCTGSTPTTLTNLITLNFIDVTNGSLVRETFTGDSNTITIPADSYYSVLISQSNGQVANDIYNLRASWSLIVDP